MASESPQVVATFRSWLSAVPPIAAGGQQQAVIANRTFADDKCRHKPVNIKAARTCADRGPAFCCCTWRLKLRTHTSAALPVPALPADASCENIFKACDKLLYINTCGNWFLVSALMRCRAVQSVQKPSHVQSNRVAATTDETATLCAFLVCSHT